MEEFDEIYRLYAADIYKFILKLSRNESAATDILQNTMLKAIVSINSYKGKCSMKTWLCTIARNEYYDYCRKADNKNLTLEENSACCESLESNLDDKLFAMRLHQILHNIDEPYKEIFSLRVFAELKFSEIGKIFGKSENWARVTFFRAKEKIINILQKEDSL
ncbi:MAG: RNA polymerase sigma factor [Ruminococcus sp.]